MSTVEIPFLLGLAAKNQSVRGTATTMPQIGAGSGAGSAINNATDGAVAGDANSGAGGSGITLGLSKSYTDKSPQAGSFTRDFGNFVSRDIASFSMAIPLKGNGSTAGSPPVAANMTPDLGIVALLRAAGLTGAANAATWRFSPAATNLITCAVYNGNTAALNGMRAILRDVEGTGLTLDFTPGELGIATFDLAGVVDSIDELGTWTATPFAYGNQATLSAPPIRGVAFQWGPSSADARALGFSTLSVKLDNQAEDIKASNTASGTVKRQTNRIITVSATIDAAAAEILFEANQLAESNIANAKSLTFLVGAVATNGSIVNGYRITVPSPELVTLEKTDPLGASEAWACEWIARATSANAEFFLDFV
jgi:hypothetical protein